jgi:hypothetical protein
VGTLQVYGYGSDGCDSSRGGPLIDSAVEARVWGPLALRFQATYSNDTDKMRPSIGGKLSTRSKGAVTVSGQKTYGCERSRPITRPNQVAKSTGELLTLGG